MTLPRWITAPVGYAAKGLGTAYDYATPGKGKSTLTNAGDAIVDPNKVYTGTLNPLKLVEGSPWSGDSSVGNGVSDFKTVASRQGSAPGNADNTVNYNGDQDAPPQVLGANTGGGAMDPQEAYERYQIESGLTAANDALGRIDGQRDTAVGNIDSQYNLAFNRLLGRQAQVARDYKTDVNDQEQGYETARNSNNANARNLLFGARRLLGQSGAGGGSADLYAVPLAATTEGNKGNAQVKQTYDRNLVGIETTKDDNDRLLDQNFEDIAGQRDQSTRSTKSAFEQNRADLLGQIATLTGQKAILDGGDYNTAINAARPYTDRVTNILKTIDTLAASKPVVQEQQFTLARPDVAEYNLGRYDAPRTVAQDPSLYQLPPAVRALLGLDTQDRRDLQLA